jgi:hypothetical protein
MRIVVAAVVEVFWVTRALVQDQVAMVKIDLDQGGRCCVLTMIEMRQLHTVVADPFVGMRLLHWDCVSEGIEDF